MAILHVYLGQLVISPRSLKQLRKLMEQYAVLLQADVIIMPDQQYKSIKNSKTVTSKHPNDNAKHFQILLKANNLQFY